MMRQWMTQIAAEGSLLSLSLSLCYCVNDIPVLMLLKKNCFAWTGETMPVVSRNLVIIPGNFIFLFFYFFYSFFFLRQMTVGSFH